MASLTPGVLSKLLDNVGNTHVKVAGEHRSALLQVINILPSFSGDDNNDPWKNKGFYLRVSDSLHSAYVSVTESDAELILNDTIQLGQFVHVTWLDSGSPVPVINGLKPVPKRRPCVGEPKDLISSEVLLIRNRVDFFKKPKLKPKLKPKPSQKVEGRRLSFGNGNGKIDGLDKLRRLSLDPTRKGWDRSVTPPAKNVKLKPSLTPSLPSTPIISRRRSFSDKDFNLERPNSSVAPLKNKNVIVSEKLITKPIRKDLKSSFDGSIPSQFSKVPVSFKSWSDTDILWDSVPPKIQNLGKEVIHHRNVGFSSAVHALEETSALEGILHCMSVFAEMCESAQKDCMNPLVEPFLNFYQSTQKAADAINSLLDTMLEDTSKNFKNKNAALWVQAAIYTDLSKFSLFKKEDQNDLRNGEKTHFLVLESSPAKAQKDHLFPENKKSPKNLGPVVSKSNSRPKTVPIRPSQRAPTSRKPAIERAEWSKRQGLKDAVTLAEKLLAISCAWFLNYLEDSFKKGFGLKTGEGDSEITGLLGQLKRVNEWLDDSMGNGSQMDERIEYLKKQLYKFLLDHVDSAIVQAGN